MLAGLQWVLINSTNKDDTLFNSILFLDNLYIIYICYIINVCRRDHPCKILNLLDGFIFKISHRCFPPAHVHGGFGKPNILSTGTRHWIWSSIESRDTELYSWIPQVMLLASFVFKVCRFLQDYGFAGWGGLLDRGLFSGAWENIIPTFSPSIFLGNSTVQLSRMRQWAFHAWQVRARFRILS